MKLPTTVGFEMTGMVSDYEEEPCRWSDDTNPTNDVFNRTRITSVAIGHVLSEMYPKLFKLEQQHTDSHCIEFASPVFTTTEEMDQFYKTVAHQFKGYGVVPQYRDITVCGGNHMHFGVSNDLTLIRNILRDFSARYYIPWVFTHPDDTDSCDNILLENVKDRWFHPVCRLRDLIFTDKVSSYLVKHASCKEFSIELQLHRQKHQKGQRTIEFRCIEAPMDYSEFVDQREFFVAYFNFARKLKNVPIPPLLTSKELNKIPARKAAKQFRAFVRKLGLNPKRYDKYIRRNLYPRWHLKRKRV